MLKQNTTFLVAWLPVKSQLISVYSFHVLGRDSKRENELMDVILDKTVSLMFLKIFAVQKKKKENGAVI